jgi:hypothetical protein
MLQRKCAAERIQVAAAEANHPNAQKNLIFLGSWRINLSKFDFAGLDDV